MKKIITFLVIIIIVVGCFFLIYNSKNKSDKNNELTKVTLAEVAHSVFYAPQYIAISEGFFEEEGIDIELTLTSGADAVMSAVLSGDVDVGFCGTEATIYVDAIRRKIIKIIIFHYGMFKKKNTFWVLFRH